MRCRHVRIAPRSNECRTRNEFKFPAHLSHCPYLIGCQLATFIKPDVMVSPTEAASTVITVWFLLRVAPMRKEPLMKYDEVAPSFRSLSPLRWPYGRRLLLRRTPRPTWCWARPRRSPLLPKPGEKWGAQRGLYSQIQGSLVGCAPVSRSMVAAVRFHHAALSIQHRTTSPEWL